jgi:polyphosphate kinase
MNVLATKDEPQPSVISQNQLLIPVPEDLPSKDRRLDEPSLYINKELSWLDFNQRVLDEALDPKHRLLERVKFLAISFSNVDEFYMIRVSGLQHQATASPTNVSTDGRTPTETLKALRTKYAVMLRDQTALWNDDLSVALHAENIVIRQYADLSKSQKKELRVYFEREIFPVLTPLAIDPGHPFPHISNLSLNLAVIVRDPVLGERYARMKVPGVVPRLVAVPVDDSVKGSHFVWLEDVVSHNLDSLFPGLEVVESYPFRVTRDADLDIAEDEASDLLQTIEQGLRQRQFGAVVRLELQTSMPANLRELLILNLLVDSQDVYEVAGPLGLTDLMQLMKVDRPDLKDVPHQPHLPHQLVTLVESRSADETFAAIANKDLFLHHPYDSFQPIIGLIEGAAHGSGVLAIKQTLYRVGSKSPIVKALIEARDEDAQVAVLVELKARFDEENNIEWAKALEDAGVHVAYGLVGLKTHCKVTLIVRKEAGQIRRYLHLGTGNYNATTARIYTDFSIFTAREDLATDVSELFNLLTGYSRQRKYRKLLVAPVNMRDRLTYFIEREAKHAAAGRPARLLFKMNALNDPQMIRALYAASRAGVKIDLIVRGTCCLRPGVPGISENIRVVSIIGRFLEHSRAYYFHNGGRTPSLYLGSADLMTRNLSRRIEVLFPVEDAGLRRHIRDRILEISLRDNVQARMLKPDGSWVRVRAQKGEPRISSQEIFMQHDQSYI